MSSRLVFSLLAFTASAFASTNDASESLSAEKTLPISVVAVSSRTKNPRRVCLHGRTRRLANPGSIIQPAVSPARRRTRAQTVGTPSHAHPGQCQPGTCANAGNDDASCIRCARGTFNNVRVSVTFPLFLSCRPRLQISGATDCCTCCSGFYSNLLGATSCSACPAGQGSAPG